VRVSECSKDLSGIPSGDKTDKLEGNHRVSDLGRAGRPARRMTRRGDEDETD